MVRETEVYSLVRKRENGGEESLGDFVLELERTGEEWKEDGACQRRAGRGKERDEKRRVELTSLTKAASRLGVALFLLLKKFCVGLEAILGSREGRC